MTFLDILADIRAKAYSEQDKGYRFERLMRSYLLTDPLYAHTLQEVWIWSDFLFRANKIVLLAYYIASINIENAYHERQPDQPYKSFEGVCLTDIFQLGEGEGMLDLQDGFVDNSRRVRAQRKAPLRIIIGNPPYSVGHKSANDNAQNQRYPQLEQRIEQTYVAASKATNTNSLYDFYFGSGSRTPIAVMLLVKKTKGAGK